MKKVWFWISGMSADKIAKIASSLFKKYKFIKINIEEEKCMLCCHDMGTYPSGWITEKLIDNKKFLGRFNINSDLYNSKLLEKTCNRYFLAVCRFGYFDLFNYPEDKEIASFTLRRFYNQKSGMPFYLADLDAFKFINKQPDWNNNIKYYRRTEYIHDLVCFFGKTKSEATKIIDNEFPTWKNIKLEKTKINSISIKKKNKLETKKTNDLVHKLQFMSPKKRKCYLQKSENIIDLLRFTAMCEIKGADWVLENIGKVPGIID
jgi:hypothetical protein